MGNRCQVDASGRELVLLRKMGWQLNIKRLGWSCRILVKVDDNMVRHYSNEDAFVMDVQTDHLEGCMSHHVTLAVV